MARKAKLNPALSTLYNAPDVRETRRLRGGIEELATDTIDTKDRFADRLSLEVEDLAKSIEQHGQRVPILVRPGQDGRYALVYGRRRLEACRMLGRPVRAIITDLEADQALKDQLLENTARRDLSFIERALIAKALIDGDILGGTRQSNRSVADILNQTDAAVSQMTKVVEAVDERLIQAIGPCPGIGRPRWEALKSALSNEIAQEPLVEIAITARTESRGTDASDEAFKAVLAAASQPRVSIQPDPSVEGAARVKAALRGKRLTLNVTVDEEEFGKWLEVQAPTLVEELHAQWKRASK